MDVRTHSALTLGWRLVEATLASLGDLAGRAKGWLPGPVWARAFAELRRAEAAARRLLVILAEDLKLTVSPKQRPRGHSSAKTAKIRSKKPGFALFDPLPGLRVTHDTGTAEPVNAPFGLHATDGLAARCCALAALREDPDPAIRRMAFWLARKGCPRTCPLRPGLPPGVCGDLMESAQDVVMQCDALARQRLNRPLPP